MKLILLRHGHTDFNLNSRLQGVSDIPLATEGVRAVDFCLSRFPLNKYNCVYSSPLRRARQTAELVAEYLGIPLVIDERLTERNLGDLEGLLFDEALDRLPAGFSLLSPDVRPVGGEAIVDLFPRVKEFVSEIIYSGESVIVVVHGVWLQAFKMVTGISVPQLENADFSEINL